MDDKLRTQVHDTRTYPLDSQIRSPTNTTQPTNPTPNPQPCALCPLGSEKAALSPPSLSSTSTPPPLKCATSCPRSSDPSSPPPPRPSPPLSPHPSTLLLPPQPSARPCPRGYHWWSRAGLTGATWWSCWQRPGCAPGRTGRTRAASHCELRHPHCGVACCTAFHSETSTALR